MTEEKDIVRYYSPAGWVTVDRKTESWAPCFHSLSSKPEDIAKSDADEKQFMDETFALAKESYIVRPGQEIETLLWMIIDIGGSPTCYADQWVGVRTTGMQRSNKEPRETFVQGDSFALALAQTYRLWREINSEKE